MVRRAEPGDAGLTRPVRTCVGCRQRATASELLRVIAVAEADGAGSGQVRIVADPRRRASGRGAHLHPTPACLALAERRRAFGRALRVAGVCDTGPLTEAIHGGTVR
ncbi:YlxR family protein [Hamadaea tsunoensis]|uniref:YlxR family protein n=1 Tax=Hamadaea tsunoensis TaxID=53368 RepID=UPI001B7FA21A|nr:YlxR family protein [Hamadaea tsunoensis]